MWMPGYLRPVLTNFQGYKSYAVRTVISGWYVYLPLYGTIAAYSVQGRELQLDYGTERIWKIEHPRRNMFRPWYQQLERGAGAESPGK